MTRTKSIVGCIVAAFMIFAGPNVQAQNGTWTNTASGGNWSGSENWLDGIVAGGGGNATFTNDLSGTSTVHLDSPRELGTLSFSDANTATPGSWRVDNNGDAANVLTANMFTVNALGTDQNVRMDTAVTSSATLTKAGMGALTLTKDVTVGTRLECLLGTMELIDATCSANGGAYDLIGNSAGQQATLVLKGNSVLTNSGYKWLVVGNVKDTTGVLKIQDNANVIRNGNIGIAAYQSSEAGGAGYMYQDGGAVSVLKVGGTEGHFCLGRNQGYGYYELNAGTLSVASEMNVGYTKGGVGVIRQTGGAITAYGYYLGREKGDFGLHELSNGSLEIKFRSYLGNAASSNGNGGAGVMRQSGGTVTLRNQLFIGSGGYGYYELSGGALTNKSYLQIGLNNSNGGIGIFYLNGGNQVIEEIADNYFNMGNNSSGTNVYYASSGVLSCGQTIYIGYNSLIGNINMFNVSGQATVDTGAYSLVLSRQGTATLNILNLNGGLLRTTAIYKQVSTGLSLVTFNGGTVSPVASGTVFGPVDSTRQAVDGAYIYAGGATFDVDEGLTATNSQSLLAPPGNGVESIALASGGSGYIGVPYVSIDGNGTGATAVAFINVTSGSVTNITITSRGYGYTTAPTVRLIGGITNGVAAVATAAVAPNSSGGLSKLGSGTLVLTSTNTYAGVTVVSNGTLRLTQTQCLSTNTAVVIGDNGILDLNFTGTIVVRSLQVDGVMPYQGVYGAAQFPGRISGDGVLKTLEPPPLGSVIRFR